MKRIVLITGGGRSGKSQHALQLSSPHRSKGFIATAEPIDAEMQARIEKHRRERDSSFVTVEEPVDLASALRALPAETEIAVIDCITVWLGNLMHRDKITNTTCMEIEDFLDILRSPPFQLILVTNEVGMGIIPADPTTRTYRDLAGHINKELALLAQEVIFMVSGTPLRIK